MHDSPRKPPALWGPDAEIDLNPRAPDSDLPRTSKTRVKKEMLALQELGARLVELPATQLAKIEMSDELRQAIAFAKTIHSREALRRQIQHIGAVMREADPEPIQRALDEIDGGQKGEARHFKKLEALRDALISGDDALLESLVAEHPALDRQRLRQLTASARKERDAEKPPKSARSLFRYLRESIPAGQLS